MQMRLAIVGLLILCFCFYRWLDSAPATTEAALAAPQQVAQAVEDPIALSSVAIEFYTSVDGEPLTSGLLVLDAWEGEALAEDFSAKLAPSGRCTFEDLRPGTYEYHIEQEGQASPWLGQLEIDSERSDPLRIDLSQLARAE